MIDFHWKNEANQWRSEICLIRSYADSLLKLLSAEKHIYALYNSNQHEYSLLLSQTMREMMLQNAVTDNTLNPDLHQTSNVLSFCWAFPFLTCWKHAYKTFQLIHILQRSHHVLSRRHSKASRRTGMLQHLGQLKVIWGGMPPGPAMFHHLR